MKTYRYTDSTNRVVQVFDEDGISRSSGLASAHLPEGVTAAPYVPSIEERKAPILAQLAALDQRKIRPLADGDTAYLATLNAQTAALRIELGAIT